HAEGALGVAVVRRRLGGHHEGQLAAGAWPVLGTGRGRRQGQGQHGEEQRCAHARSHGRGLLFVQANIEKSSAFSVMNSSSAGTPSRVLATARRMAGTMSWGWLTRSPWPPSALAKSA